MNGESPWLELLSRPYFMNFGALPLMRLRILRLVSTIDAICEEVDLEEPFTGGRGGRYLADGICGDEIGKREKSSSFYLILESQ